MHGTGCLNYVIIRWHVKVWMLLDCTGKAAYQCRDIDCKLNCLVAASYKLHVQFGNYLEQLGVTKCGCLCVTLVKLEPFTSYIELNCDGYCDAILMHMHALHVDVATS